MCPHKTNVDTYFEVFHFNHIPNRIKANLVNSLTILLKSIKNNTFFAI